MSTQHFIEPGERRQTPRLDRDETLFIQVTRCDAEPDFVGTTVLCSTLDVSATGLKLITQRPVKTDIELDLWVNIDGRPGKYFLSGNVQWCTPSDGKHSAGVQLLELENTDFLGWAELFS